VVVVDKVIEEEPKVNLNPVNVESEKKTRSYSGLLQSR